MILADVWCQNDKPDVYVYLQPSWEHCRHCLSKVSQLDFDIYYVKFQGYWSNTQYCSARDSGYGALIQSAILFAPFILLLIYQLELKSLVWNNTTVSTHVCIVTKRVPRCWSNILAKYTGQIYWPFEQDLEKWITRSLLDDAKKATPWTEFSSMFKGCCYFAQSLSLGFFLDLLLV